VENVDGVAGADDFDAAAGVSDVVRVHEGGRGALRRWWSRTKTAVLVFGVEGFEDIDDSERRGAEDADGAAGADDADGARVSATSERTPDDMVGLEQQHEKSMRYSQISTML